MTGDSGPLVDTQAAILAAGVSKRTLHRRVAAGRLQPAGRDRRGRTLYRLSDVLAALPNTSGQTLDTSGTLRASGTPLPDAGSDAITLLTGCKPSGYGVSWVLKGPHQIAGGGPFLCRGCVECPVDSAETAAYGALSPRRSAPETRPPAPHAASAVNPSNGTRKTPTLTTPPASTTSGHPDLRLDPTNLATVHQACNRAKGARPQALPSIGNQSRQWGRPRT